jgi:uroporphyrinogen-III synthase
MAAPMRLLITRPQPGADATAATLAALGHQPVVQPLLATEAADWALPATPPDAVLITSAASVRHAGAAAAALMGLPAHAVGGATAAAARAAGWRAVREGPGNVQALLDGLPPCRLLHLAGADRTDAQPPAGVVVDIATVYRAVLKPLAALPDVAGVLLYSARTARHFAAEWDRLGGARGAVKLYAISPAALAAAGSGWASAQAAPQPTEAALLAMLPRVG